MPTQAGRFDTEEDVLRYMLDPFPWLLMVVYQLDQEHKIAGSVAEASAKTSDSAASTEGESMSQEDSSKKSGTVTTSADEAAAPKKKGKQGKKGKGGHGPKAPNQAAQKDKKFEMLKASFAKKDAEDKKIIVELRAENARLRGTALPTEQPNQELAPAPKEGPKLDQLESIQLHPMLGMSTKDSTDVSP